MKAACHAPSPASRGTPLVASWLAHREEMPQLPVVPSPGVRTQPASCVEKETLARNFVRFRSLASSSRAPRRVSTLAANTPGSRIAARRPPSIAVFVAESNRRSRTARSHKPYF